MTKRIRNRLLITLGVTVLAVWRVAAFPGFIPSLTHVKENIRLGLDLRGGTHLVLQVVTDDAIRAETDQAIETLRQLLSRDNIIARQLIRSQNNEFKAVGVDPAKDADFRRILNERFTEWDLVSTQGDVPNTYTMRLKPAQEQAFREQSVDQAMNTIRNRIDQLGVGEVVIQKHGGPGENEILVQLPGMDDPARVKGVMQSTALLELKLVDSGPFPSQAAAAQNYGGVIPAHLEVLPSAERDLPNSSESSYVVNRVAAISGRDLKGAYPSRDQNGRPAVSFNLSADGAQRFGRVTEENIGKMLAIVLDGRIQSAPRIDGRITDSGIITGGTAGFAPQAAQDLALVLRSGALPASIRYLQEQVVGPSLGADSVRAGFMAAAVALVSVVVFMLFYYRFSGVNATVAMILNLLILLGAMAYFGATLTLPGIAGVILTIGVGIDSNVLIFERIREELRAGKAAVSAVTTSFSRVFVTLVDTHLAALISATFLFLFGTGPVKGFAVTLVIGLISNMFTSVFVSRTLFELVLARKERAEAISI
ncbi:MAG: protein translocase subunit SecD [Acidobacteria bacterium]|nr:MAG: protein translocase subunit SecD [Acidobacteriota bacterium]